MNGLKKLGKYKMPSKSVITWYNQYFTTRLSDYVWNNKSLEYIINFDIFITNGDQEFYKHKYFSTIKKLSA